MGLLPARDEIMKTWPPSLREMGQRGPRQAEGRGEVRADDGVPGLVGGLGEVREGADGGVVDEDLQAVERRDRGFHRSLADGGVAQVAGEGAGPAALRLDLPHERVQLAAAFARRP